MTTIKHVAKRAGVSVSTVSHALSGKRPVSDETRARILEAIKELGYQPSTYAQSLVTGRSRTIGILFPLENEDDTVEGLNAVQFEMVLAANSVLQAKGYALHVYTQTEDEAMLRSCCRLCDGLLIASLRINDKRVDYLRAQHYPFVVIGRPSQTEGVTWVDTDFDSMIMQQLSHLVELGHREIMYLDRPEHLFDEQFGYVVRTRQAYLEACAMLKLKPLVHACEVSVDAGYRAMLDLLREHPSLTALAAFNDVAAVGAYYALLAQGLRVPQDFSIISFTSHGFLRTTVPTMTALYNTGPAVSRTAAEMLVDFLQAPLTPNNGTHENNYVPKGVLIQSSLIRGQTTGKAPERLRRST